MAQMAEGGLCVWADQPGGDAITHADLVFPETTPPTALIRGRWYTTPPVGGPVQAARKTQALQLLQLVSADADTRELEEVFRREPSLGYQLVKLVNAAGTRSARTVSSFSQAILMLGRQTLQRWLQLMVFAAQEEDPRCTLLLPHVVLRARGMELLSKAAGADRHAQEEAFITGMFSMLGVLFGQPTAEVIAPLALAPPMRSALTTGTGELGHLLQTWEAMEEANFSGLTQKLEKLALDTTTFNNLLAEACQWVGRTLTATGRVHA